MKTMRMVSAAAAFLLLSFCGVTRAADPALKARAKALLEKNKEAIVTVKLVITTRTTYGGRQTNKRESKSEVPGTVLDSSGLTVVSNFASDPSAALNQMSMSMGGEKMQIKMESDITDSKIVLADGTELPAQFVLKDKDLDLAFFKPKEKAEKPFAHVPFAKTPAPKILDDTICIGRLSRAVKRVNSVTLGNIQAIVMKPRMFYICDFLSGFTSMGCPVFNAKGETLGLSVIKMNPAHGSGMGMMGGMQPVVVPSADLLDVAKQAAAAKVKVKTKTGEEK